MRRRQQQHNMRWARFKKLLKNLILVSTSYVFVAMYLLSHEPLFDHSLSCKHRET